MNSWIVLPVLIPLATAAGSFLLFRWRMAQRACGLIGATGLLITSLLLLCTVWRSGIQTVQIGGWPAPFGITIVADLFSAILVTVAGAIGFTVALYSLADVGEEHEAFHYYSLTNLLLAGVCGAFLTGDIFNLYVWFEVMLIASFVLLALGNQRPQLSGALKYVSINLVSSALFLSAVGILYGSTGALNMAELAITLRQGEQTLVASCVATLLLVAFGVKAAIFPFFTWLPASYPAPPAAVSAMFAGLLTEVGVYGLVRAFTLLFAPEHGFALQLLLIMSVLTMIAGALGAVAQTELRRTLSFLVVSHIGVMLLGLSLGTPLALSGLVFYLMHHTIAQSSVFLVSGIATRLCGVSELREMGGLYANHPGLAVLFAIPALALAAFPPFSGFFPTVVLLRAALEREQFVAAGVVLITDFLTLFVMARIWTEVFWKQRRTRATNSETSANQSDRQPNQLWPFLAPIGLLTATSAAISVSAGPLSVLASKTSYQLMDEMRYIEAVLGGSP